MPLAVALVVLVAAHLPGATGDVYLNNPRGSNNKLNEKANTRANANRLFDSQNNDNAGYQVGDNCWGPCKVDTGGNGPAGAKEDEYLNEGGGAGTMRYYEGSELYVEWHAQHGCGVGHPNVICQYVLQYMCNDTEEHHIRDGVVRTAPAASKSIEEGDTFNGEPRRGTGYHESVDYYRHCVLRARNKGLYTADQNMRGAEDRGAQKTRQNNNNERFGLECPEERDYYPYWHPSPWHDIAVLTSEPERRCGYYQAESQNVKPKGHCEMRDDGVRLTRVVLANAKQAGGQYKRAGVAATPNNPKDCERVGTWVEEPAWGEPPPECLGAVTSRDNHNGNARNGQPMYYLWKVPSHILKSKGEATCVLRLRYNITTGDFRPNATINRRHPRLWADKDVGGDYFSVDSRFNSADGNQGGLNAPPIIGGNPGADFLNLGRAPGQYKLSLRVNTDQYGRTFQDRTHVFKVARRPRGVGGGRIVNFNVRGRRGNIGQVYPSVEYDFVPTDLRVQQGDHVHFQWTGSDRNVNNGGNNAAGYDGTDRSNLVQVADREGNVPLPIEEHTLFFDARRDPNNKEGRDLAARFAYLDQYTNDLPTERCKPGLDNGNDGPQRNDVGHCGYLNRAPAYFDGGLVKMKTLGKHHVMSTRNNNFSNRSQKATIEVLGRDLRWWELLLLVSLAVALVSLAAYTAAAAYAWRRPGSWLFAKRFRPRILEYMGRAKVSMKEETRRQIFRQERENLRQAAEVEMGTLRQRDRQAGKNKDSRAGAAAQPGPGDPEAGGKRRGVLGTCGQNMFMWFNVYILLNAAVFGVGFVQHWGGGFRGHMSYACAKGAGYTLDLNFAMLILPTLKSLQTTLRGKSGISDLIPMDDPIEFHIFVAKLIAAGSVLHVVMHVKHMREIAGAPPMQHDVLGQLDMSEEDHLSGTSMADQFFSGRLAAVSGTAVAMLMLLMYITASGCVRRGTNCVMKLIGGFRIFAMVHSAWFLVYALLLAHAPARLWIWFFFPVLFVLVDRLLMSQNHRPFARLIAAEVLAFDVLHLQFELPDGFTYQAGQYVLLGWRGEWHPFTLTSAPEERVLTLHIRAPDTLDWCSALRRRLAFEAPVMAGIKNLKYPVPAGTAIKYVRCVDLRNGTVYSRPDTGRTDAPLRQATAALETAPVVVDAIDPEDMDRSFSESDSTLPEDAVILKLSGPFGAPAQRVWEYETILVVGSGIGVTPFVSITRSIQERAKHRNAIAGSDTLSSARPARGRDDGRTKSREELVRAIVPMPTRVHFVWIIRDQREVDWFYELLCSAVQGPAKNIIEIEMHITGEIELSKVRKLDCAAKQFLGRPNWGRIFKELKQQHPADNIGVFLCGSPEIGRELARQSSLQSDPPHARGGVTFSFYKENF